MEHRTGARTYTVRMKKRNLAVTSVVVLLSITLLAGIVTLSPLGDYLTEHVFLPIVSFFRPEQKEDQGIVSALKTQEQASASPTLSASPTPLENNLIVTETPYYLLQMGVFTEESRAMEHAEQIRAMGAAGLIYQEQSLYRVFAAAYRDEESLKKVQSQVRTDGFEATPYISEQNSVRIKLKGNATAVQTAESAITILGEIPDMLCDLSLQFDKQAIDGIQVKETIREMLTRLNEILQNCHDLPDESIEPLKTSLEKYQERISTFLKEHDTIVKENAGDLKYLQIACIIDYIQFFERN